MSGKKKEYQKKNAEKNLKIQGKMVIGKKIKFFRSVFFPRNCAQRFISLLLNVLSQKVRL